MLKRNSRRRRRESLVPKRFRPAPVELRPRQEAATPVPRSTGRRLRWVRPLAVAGLLVASFAWTVASPERAERLTATTASLQGWAAEATLDAQQAWDRHLRAGAVVDAYAALEAEHQRLRIEAQRLRAVEQEHRRLSALLGISEAHALEGLAARVIARGGSGRQTLRLDLGAEHGVRAGLAVVSAEGVVGQVVSVGEGWSEVLAVTDPLHGCTARIADLNLHGTVRGTASALSMDHVLARHQVEAGALVVTTGEGGVFPPDLPLGTVASSAPQLGGPFLAITVEPLAPPELLSEVLVVTDAPPPSELANR